MEYMLPLYVARSPNEIQNMVTNSIDLILPASLQNDTLSG